MTRSFLPGLVVALGVLALGLVVAFTVGAIRSRSRACDVLLAR
jgi:hypothetical protein